MYTEAPSGKREVAFSPSMARKFRLRSAHLSSPMFNYEKRLARHRDFRNVHPEVRVNPMANSEEDAAKVPQEVVPQVCAELMFSSRDGFTEGVDFDLGCRAVRVPLPYAICIRVSDMEGDICPVSARIELNPDQVSSMLISMISAYATFEKGEDDEGRSVYEDVVLTFWGAPDTYAKECTASFVVTVTDTNDESYETTFCVTAHSVEPVVAVECPNAKSKVQKNDTHVTFTAGKTGEESITVWNETEGNAPLLLNVLIRDSAKGIFSIGRRSDDSSICFAATLPSASSFSFVVRFDLSYAQLKQSSYYGCVLIKLANMLPKRTRTWGDRDLHWTYDHVLALQISPNDEDFSCDLPSEEMQTPSEDFYDFEEFLRAEGEDDIEDIYPLNLNVAACDSEELPDDVEEGPLYEGSFSMLEPVEWVLSEEIENATDDGEDEPVHDQKEWDVDYASSYEGSEVKDSTGQELDVVGESYDEHDANWKARPSSVIEQHLVRKTDPTAESVEANAQRNVVEDECNLIRQHDHLFTQFSSEVQGVESEEANLIEFDRPEVVPSANRRPEQEHFEPAANAEITSFENLPSSRKESLQFSAQRQQLADKTPFGKLVGYGPISDRLEAKPVVSKKLELVEAHDYECIGPVAPVFGSGQSPVKLNEADSNQENDEQSSSILYNRESTESEARDIVTTEKVENSSFETNALSCLNGLSRSILQSKDHDVGPIPSLSLQQVSKPCTQSRRDTLDSSFAQFGSIASSKGSVVPSDNPFSSSTAQSVESPHVSNGGRINSDVLTGAGDLPSNTNEIALGNVDSCASRREAETEDPSLMMPLHGVLKSDIDSVSRNSTGADISRFKAQRQNASKPPKIPNRQQAESFALRDHRQSLTTGRAQESLSSVSTFTSVRDSGMVVKTAQKFTLRSVFNKDMRPKLRMPRRIQQKGLYLLARRGSVVLPIFNASSVDIEVHARVETAAGCGAKVMVNPGFVVVQPSQRSEFVITRNSASSGMLSIVLLCKSVRNERSVTAYRVPLIVEALKIVVEN